MRERVPTYGPPMTHDREDLLASGAGCGQIYLGTENRTTENQTTEIYMKKADPEGPAVLSSTFG
ncbi:unannotated protein [freshwater metagenome]|uniref:Unannotated protein n=1 Tax=freshwater metagenome TaxID=449393 RepID=A0A6J7KS86_9ZZZZ